MASALTASGYSVRDTTAVDNYQDPDVDDAGDRSGDGLGVLPLPVGDGPVDGDHGVGDVDQPVDALSAD
jgi:hypothetical protein